VTGRQESKFGTRKSSLHDVNQREPLVVMKLEVRKKWLISFTAMTSEMDPGVVLETSENRLSIRLLPD
jgi:hypothetical protein